MLDPATAGLAAGLVAALKLVEVGFAAARKRRNGNVTVGYDLKRCEARGERIKGIEVSLAALVDTVAKLAESQKGSAALARMAENAQVIVMNERGERLAVLETSNVRVFEGIARIEIALHEIEKVMRTQK
jgi:hypothetical protein